MANSYLYGNPGREENIGVPYQFKTLKECSDAVWLKKFGADTRVEGATLRSDGQCTADFFGHRIRYQPNTFSCMFRGKIDYEISIQFHFMTFIISK